MALVGQEQFIRLLAIEFDLQEENLRPGSRLADHLEFDSLEILRLAVFLEMLVPFDLPEGADFDSLTVGDIYGLYCAEYAEQMLRGL